jgi:hypothetical protein
MPSGNQFGQKHVPFKFPYADSKNRWTTPARIALRMRMLVCAFGFAGDVDPLEVEHHHDPNK